MSASAVCLESLARHIRARGVDDCDLKEDVLHVPGIAMEFRTEDIKIASSRNGHRLSVVIEARPRHSPEAGVRVLAVGSGTSSDEAAVDAGHQWAASVMPPLMSYLLPEQPQDDVYRMPIVVGVADTGERFGWTAHLGPVVARSWGPPGTTDSNSPEIDPDGAFRPIFDVVHQRAAHRKLMWVESFAIRYPGKVNATCRLSNNDWEEGRDALLDWAMHWPDPKPFTRSRRQFVVMQPTSLDGPQQTLLEPLDEEMRKQRRP